MDIVLAVFAIIFLLLWLLWSFAPILPGPPISLLGLLMLELSSYDDFGMQFWLIMIVLTAISMILDYIIPIWGTKKFGGSKAGTRWATGGLIVWLFLGPLGIILGPFVWAIVGELMNNKTGKQAIKSGMGSLLWFALGTGLKFVVTGLMLWYGIAAIIN